MSRCTPGHGWTSRMRRSGGMGPIQAKRAVQFQKLAQVAESGTKRQRDLAPHAIAFLEGNPVRVLGHSSEVFFGWHDRPKEFDGYYDTISKGYL
jgi:hypothetical protein